MVENRNNNIVKTIKARNRFAVLFLQTLYLALILSLFGGIAGVVAQEKNERRQGESGLGVPRFESLRASRVNLRRGPGTKYPTAWVYRRAGLPVEIIKEFEHWRQIRDSDGSTGWILRTLLSRRRTALVLPWEVTADGPRKQVALRKRASTNAESIVRLEVGVITNISSCDGTWCQVIIDKYRGYMPQKFLWGVYAGEVVP